MRYAASETYILTHFETKTCHSKWGHRCTKKHYIEKEYTYHATAWDTSEQLCEKSSENMYDFTKQLLYSRMQWFSMTMHLAPEAKTRFWTPRAKSPTEDFSPYCIWKLLRQFSSYYKTLKKKKKNWLCFLDLGQQKFQRDQAGPTLFM